MQFFAGVRCKQPKLRVFLGWMLGKKWKESELFHDPGKVPEEPLDILAQYQASLVRTKALRRHVESAAEFGPPGKVMYLKPTGLESEGKRRGGKIRQYKAVWIQASSLVDEGVIVSSRMMADHVSTGTINAGPRLIKLILAVFCLPLFCCADA